MFFKRRRNLQMMHIDFIDEDYDGALDEFDSSSSDDDSTTKDLPTPEVAVASLDLVVKDQKWKRGTIVRNDQSQERLQQTQTQ